MAHKALLFALPLALLFANACTDDTDGLGDSCETSDDCPADQHCENSECVAGTGNECTTDAECGKGRVCDIVRDCGATRCTGNTCVDKTCTTHDECWPDGQVCRMGTCQDPESCDDLGACLDDLYCNDQNLCVPPDGSCTDDDGCPGDLICVSNGCVTATPCTDSTECPSNLNCIGGVCRDPCTMDEDCGNPNTNACDASTGECQARCLVDAICPPNQICEMNLCVPAQCTMDSECDQLANEICQGAMDGRGRCVEVTPCGPNGECPEGFGCDTTTNRCEPLPPCRTDRDCAGQAFCDNGFCRDAVDCSNSPCPMGFDCVADVCVPTVCRGDADCVAPELCLGGECQMPMTPNAVVEVRIITPAGVVRPTTTYAFQALAIDQAGRAVPGVMFEWLTSDATIADIDMDGLATGGAVPGVAEIRARVQTTMGPVTSNPVELTNLGPLPAGVSVTVLRGANGTPIAGADVEITGAFGTETVQTDAQGVAQFVAAPAGPYSITAAHVDHDFVSVLDVTTQDVVIPLPPLRKPDLVAGVKGSVDLSQVSTQGGLSLSLSGASLPSPLLSFDAADLFGGDLINVNVPMVGNIGIPAGNTVEVDFMGFQIPLKTEYYARAQPGLRSVWSFGGRIGIDNGGGFGDLNNLVALILPFFQRFEHDVVATKTMVSIPGVVDTNDFDGDGDTTETIPDWNSFPAQNMQPKVAQSLRYQLTVSNLPFVVGGNANTLVVIAGTLLPSIGFVPLGLDGQTDDAGNGIVPSFLTKMAPPHSGLEVGEYAVLASAVRIDGALPGPGSVRMFVGPTLPAAVDLSTDGWLDSPIDSVWSDTTREVSVPAVAGSDMYRISFAHSEGTWHVYGPAPAGAGALVIPSAPAGMIDRTTSATVTVDAVDLDPAASPATVFDLSAGGNLGLDRVTRGFSRAVAGR